jgi:hypothetical protein
VRSGERPLIGEREAKHLRLGDGVLRRLSRSGDDEVADAAPFDLGGALDDRAFPETASPPGSACRNRVRQSSAIGLYTL